MKTMKTVSILAMTVAAMLLWMTAAMAQEDRPTSYLMLKAGIYDPSNDLTINGQDNDGIDLNSHTRFFGEAAIGHYFAPFLAFELGAGYFENKGTAANQAGTAKLKVIPVVLTGKLLAPLGYVEPYILGGIGAYLTDFSTDVSESTASGATKLTYGLHAGAGINFDLSRWFFLGVEGRYLWSDPHFGWRDLKLNGFAATGDIGFRF